MIRPKNNDEYKALMTWAKLQIKALISNNKALASSIRGCNLPPGYDNIDKKQVCTISYNGQTGEIHRVTVDEVIFNV